MSANPSLRSAESPHGGGRIWKARGARGQAAAPAAPRRKMEHIASVSRSSGLEKDGDALTEFQVQEEYREFIQGKFSHIWLNYAGKLREGIVSSKRTDKFALEVYETSLYLATLSDSPRHVSSVIPALASYFHLPSKEPNLNCIPAILICLLHHLVAAYPSQREFHSYLASVPTSFFPTDSAERTWISALSSSIRARNYAKIDKLTQLSALPAGGASRELARMAFYHVVDALRAKTREMAWTVMRAAYRELWCQSDSDTQDWLVCSLGLRSGIPGGHDIDLDEWLERESGLGHVRKKEGVDGRWILCRS
ncbi:hypothetical protein B0H10DRAFT_1809488 [Mycena sp. CBHHK59/15]|nr:hypothetical protein B0H10DRAFT_1809488 [Mycena sp. CBHHK59/15]